MLSRTSSHMWGPLELASVPVEGWIIDPDVHDLLHGPCDVANFPTHYRVVVHTDVMMTDVGMVIDGGRGPKVFLEAFLRGSCRFPCVLLITIQIVTFMPVDYPFFLCDVIPSLGGQYEVLDCVASFKVDLDPHLVIVVVVDIDVVVIGGVVAVVLGLGNAISMDAFDLKFV